MSKYKVTDEKPHTRTDDVPIGFVQERVEWTEGPGLKRWRCRVTIVSNGQRTEHATEWHLLEDFTARWATVRANAKLALVDRMGPGA